MSQQDSSEFSIRSMLSVFIKDDIKQCFVFDSNMKLRLSIYACYFLVFSFMCKILFNTKLGFSNLVMFLGLFAGVFVRNTLKNVMDPQAATMSGIAVTMAFLMLSIFFRILL